MDLNHRAVRGVVVMDLVGRLTSADGGLLADRVARLLTEGHTQFVFNLSQLNYMDSSGLGAMVSCYSKVRKAGGHVKLAALTDRIQDLLSITRLVTVFESYDSEELALASFNVPAEA
jgi:anti-sigma B factor antagonist